MRMLVLSVSALCVACLGATYAIAQTDQWGPAEDQIPPYLTHMDRRHGHDHVYPDRGAVVRDVPQGAIAVNYAGISYRFAGGVWYEPRGPAYIVVAPPIGLIVPQVPAFATNFDRAGKPYVYANDVFYMPRPDLGGYEVVNDPEDLAPEPSQARSGASRSRLASVAPGVPRALPQVAAPAQAAAPAQDGAPAQAAAQPPAQPAIGPPAQPPTQPAMQSPAQSDTEVPSPAAPPAAPTSASPGSGNPTGVAIYPRKGQNADQQAMDRYECYRFAVGQTGIDPLASNASTAPAEVARRDAEYSRAQAACLEGRGYRLQ